jgi:RNase H-fold protein (predicted Holliday junction resolvase)
MAAISGRILAVDYGKKNIGLGYSRIGAQIKQIVAKKEKKNKL